MSLKVLILKSTSCVACCCQWRRLCCYLFLSAYNLLTSSLCVCSRVYLMQFKGFSTDMNEMFRCSFLCVYMSKIGLQFKHQDQLKCL